MAALAKSSAKNIAALMADVLLHVRMIRIDSSPGHSKRLRMMIGESYRSAKTHVKKTFTNWYIFLLIEIPE
jgi:hypothetical protein